MQENTTKVPAYTRHAITKYKKKFSLAFFLKVSTGSVDNIKPELVLASLYERCGLTYNENAIQIHRCEVYARDEQEQLIPLDAMGEEII